MFDGKGVTICKHNRISGCCELCDIEYEVAKMERELEDSVAGPRAERE